MTRSLIEYFRYSFRKNQALVPLREEMAHVRNYLKIQALRYPKALTCEINMPDYVGMTPVPPLIVQNFAENSIKYAIMVNKPVQLTIQASFIEAAPECAPCVEILITDTGPGFPADVLAQLQAGIPMKDGGESRIGTWNARRRLQLIYQGQATIEFANQVPQGAVVRIRLPLRPTGRQENPEEA
jgi:two-component system sensor histidine kinase YesM